MKKKLIQVLNLNLEYIFYFKLSFSPVSIKGLDITIGICGDRETCFFDLKTQAK